MFGKISKIFKNESPEKLQKSSETSTPAKLQGRTVARTESSQIPDSKCEIIMTVLDCSKEQAEQYRNKNSTWENRLESADGFLLIENWENFASQLIYAGDAIDKESSANLLEAASLCYSKALSILNSHDLSGSKLRQEAENGLNRLK